MRMKSVAAATAMLVISATAHAAPASRFLHDAAQGDYSEVTLGKYIESHGHADSVRTFGSQLATDHGKGLTAVQALAKKMKVSAPATMKPGAKAELDKLHRLKGAAFDAEVRRYMIDDHKKDIAKFTDQANHGDKQTAALASDTLPVLKKHLEMAEALPK